MDQHHEAPTSGAPTWGATTWGPTEWVLAAERRLRAEACPGWIDHGRCTDDRGRRMADPHPTCLRAQYRHDLAVLEHGPLGAPDPLHGLARPA